MFADWGQVQDYLSPGTAFLVHFRHQHLHHQNHAGNVGADSFDGCVLHSEHVAIPDVAELGSLSWV